MYVPKHLPDQDYFFFCFVLIYFVFCHSAHFAVLNLEIISNEHINTDLTCDRICYSAQLKLPVHRSGSPELFPEPGSSFGADL